MEIKLLIGLGNPGKEFGDTYHNVGQLFVDELAGQGAKFKKEKYFEYIKNGRLVLVKTSIFMNQSGGAVAGAKKYFNVKPDQILIVHDDSDISLGNFKLSFARNSAGHQGVESVIKSLRTNRFYRLRVGVRPPREIGRTKANDLVLKKISKRELKILKDLFREIGLQYLKAEGKAYSAVGFRQDA
ncbi:MAG: aminoacyl-tRNA hydrolase [Candidatus Colwellbacteria bacterium]